MEIAKGDGHGRYSNSGRDDSYRSGGQDIHKTKSDSNSSITEGYEQLEDCVNIQQGNFHMDKEIFLIW